MAQKGCTVEWSNSDKKGISWNKLYASPHWAQRKKIIDGWHKFFTVKLLEHKKVFCNTYEVEMEVNSRMDVDNVLVMAKMFVDTLRKNGWIKDDTPKYYKKLSVVSNKETMKSGSYKITLKKIT